MQRRAKMIIKEKLSSFGANVAFASLFGSFRRGDYDEFSDIDLLVVYEDEKDADRVSKRLKYLEKELHRPVHINLFSLKEFKKRINLNDYLLASIIEDSSFILGRKDLFLDAKRKISEPNLNEESIIFNRKMGVNILNNVHSFFDEFFNHEDAYFHLIKGLNDFRLALGYIYTSVQMQRLGKIFSNRRMMQTEFGLHLKEIAQIERSIKRGINFSYTTIHELIDGLRSMSLRILEEKDCSSKRSLIPAL